MQSQGTKPDPAQHSKRILKLSQENKRKQHGGPPRPARTKLEQFFANATDTPLADAFTSKGAVHPFVGMQPVPPQKWGAIWDEISQTPRSGKSVAYIHIPFCENHCLFCGFYQNAWRPDAGPTYVDMVVNEMRASKDEIWQSQGPIHAVYFGGGTPSALDAPQLAQLLDAVHKYLPLAPDCEITIEGRIHNFTDEKVQACLDHGTNRISIGVQTFKERLRNRMGRKAGRAQIIEFLEGLVATDRAAVVIDLIYGFPEQSLAEWEDDVKTAIATGIHGIDLYSLNLIDSTPLVPAIEKGKFEKPPEMSEKGAYYLLGNQLMHDARWQGISSTHWRRDTRERNFYNLMVKSGANCLAFGSGAGGLLNGYSFRNDGNLESYMQKATKGEKTFSFLMKQPDEHALFNRIKAEMELGRLNVTWLASQFGDKWEGAISPLIRQWGDCGLLTYDGDWIDLTLAGRFWQVTMTVSLLEWIKLTLARPIAA